MTSRPRSDSSEASALDTLRAATRVSHADLEARLRVNLPGAGRAELVHYLSYLRPWLAPLDTHVWVRRWPEALQASRRHAKIEWLDADLAKLGAEPLDMGVITPSARGRLQALGLAYVIEGAMLGGRTLGRRFAPTLEIPLRYFEGYGADTGAMWRSLIDEIERSARTQAAREQMADAAVQGFQSIARWMDESGAMS